MDGNILLFIQEHLRCEILNKLFILISSLGDAGFIWMILCLTLLVPKKTRVAGALGLCSLIFGYILNDQILKNIFQRPRPFQIINNLVPLVSAGGYSFPSGHTSSSFATAFTLYKLLPRKYGILVLVFAALMAFSRLYVGVHYPTDVLAGIIVGWISSLVILKLVKNKRDT